MPIQCRCGRFMSVTYPVVAQEGEGYGWHEFIKEVRGDCSRCGPGVLAAPGPWMSWDAWTWSDPTPALTTTGDPS